MRRIGAAPVCIVSRGYETGRGAIPIPRMAVRPRGGLPMRPWGASVALDNPEPVPPRFGRIQLLAPVASVPNTQHRRR